MGWSGDLQGTNATGIVTLTTNASIGAVFGTSLATTVTGNGSLTLFPLASLYPYGCQVSVTAVPSPGNFFGLWGGSVSGNQNPLAVQVVNSNQSISSLFAALPTNQFALTVISKGGGSVSVTPFTNRYQAGNVVQLFPIAIAGQQFLNWSGDATGAAAPLAVVMNTNKVITANFTHVPSLSLTTAAPPLGISVSGVSGDVFRIDASTNLTSWAPLATLTNFFNGVSLSDPGSSNLPYRLYRAVAQ